MRSARTNGVIAYLSLRDEALLDPLLLATRAGSRVARYESVHALKCQSFTSKIDFI